MRQLLSLRHWTLAIIVLPTVVIGILLGGYLTYKRYVELEQNLVDRGIYLSEPLTLFASQALISPTRTKSEGNCIRAIFHLSKYKYFN